MQLKMVSKDDYAIRIQSEGPITQSITDNDPDPIQELLGPEAYAQQVLLNMENSDHLTSYGIGWLLRCHKRFGKAGGKLVLHSVPPMVLESLKLLRLHRLFHLAADEAAALSIVTGDQS
mgnify:CR=1 FL=1